MSTPTRLTPAYAGSTIEALLWGSASGAHPRICGEHVVVAIRTKTGLGSPPHMRGAPDGSVCGYVEFRLTPAYAGSTLPHRGAVSMGGAHPRICGEHGLMAEPPTTVVGSPPHMRGALTMPLRNVIDHGLTPAYAGSTIQVRQAIGSTRAHPRICGEHK
ncbi:Hypothetical protein PFR_JS9-2_2040 [Propionibacterium freudenreichii]|nr:Hypothetical protein PFR_JS9-1_2042 [Propionibacterium freudenreichii]SCQ70629.1 Hypothetical protein PFR_JS9-2_2040 [Propionibacterium freudenreichii]